MSETAAAVLDVSVFERVIEHGTVEARRALAENLCDFLNDVTAANEEKQAVVVSMLRLAVDPVLEIRRTIANRLKKCATLHPDLLFTIIADENDIALDFLRKTPALDPFRMMAILKVGDTERQRVVAGRGDLCAEAVNEICENCEEEVAAELLDNPAAQVTGRHCKRLYSRFSRVPEITDRLLARPDLPLEIRILQAKRASSRIQQLVTQRRWLPANDAGELVIDTEEGTLLKILISASDAELARLMPFLSSRKMLTPSIILRAACIGELHVVEHALGYLASVPVKKVRGMFCGKGTLGVHSLHRKTGLPASCLPLLRAVTSVARSEYAEQKTLEVGEFGRKLIEFLMMSEKGARADERAVTLALMSKFCDDRTRQIALRLKDDLLQAA